MRRLLLLGAALLIVSWQLTTSVHPAFAQAIVSVGPSSISAGDTVFVSGSDFQPDESVTICLDTPGTFCEFAQPVQSDGSFGPESFTIPADTPAGNYQACATGDLSGQVCDFFTISGTAAASAPNISVTELPNVTPDAVAPGSTICASGSGFSVNGGVDITTDLPNYVPPSPQAADENGDLGCDTDSIFVPTDTPAGTYNLFATDVVTGLTATATFTVTGAAPPSGTPDTTASPSTLNAGDSFTLFGTGWNPGATVRNCLLDGSVVPNCADTTADSSGSFAISLAVSVGTATGPLQVESFEVDSPANDVFATVQVADTVSFDVSPDPVQAGGTTVVSGSGFADGTVKVSILKGTNTTIATQSDSVFGGVISIPMTVPDGTPPGRYTVQLFENGTVVGQTSLQVSGTPAISFSPSVVTAGNSFTILGTNFPQLGINLEVTFALSTGALQKVDAFAAVGSNGSFTTSPISVPADAAPGLYTVTATPIGDAGSMTSNVLVVQQATSLSVSPGTVAAGSPVSVVGTGFGANETVQVKLTSGKTAYGTQTVLSSPSGSITLNVPVPASAPAGAYTVTASGLTSKASAHAGVTVTGAPIFTVSPTVVGPKSSATLSGQNFAPNSAVSITATIPLAGGKSQAFTTSVKTKANGAFSTSAVIPASAASATVTFTATQGKVTKTASLTIQAASAAIAPATNQVHSGTSVQLSLSGFAPGPGAPITITAQFITGAPSNPHPLPYTITVDPNSAGNVLVTLSVPGLASPGPATISATQASSGASATAKITVVTPIPPPPPHPSPHRAP